MNLRPKYKDRYPGLNPFDQSQAGIFYGREKEKKELFHQVCLEKSVVLFSRSGLGKSSLLNAGVAPLLSEAGYIPIRVRFSPPAQPDETTAAENLLLRDLILSFKGYRFKKQILYNKEEPQLWEYVKAALKQTFGMPVAELQSAVGNSIVSTGSSVTSYNNTDPAIPVFIFDQFEEFFNHPIEHQKEFLKQLAEVMHDETPYRILEWITREEPEKRTAEQIAWHQQPPVKLVFALRSDKLAKMQFITGFIPTILRSRYELKPLSEEQAKEAIEGPAMKELGADYTPAFSFHPDTLNELVAKLSKGTNEIESSQLQIVCNYIERKVREHLADDPGKQVLVNQDIIKPNEDFASILNNFYESQLALITDAPSRFKVQNLIEEELVVDNQRDSISEKKLIRNFGFTRALIDDMMATRLIREESSSRGLTYELSHDTLISTVEQSRDERREEEEKAKAEKEKQELAELAQKRDQELKENYKKLITEVQLRQEAEEQRKQADYLRKRLKQRGFWVFLLLLIIVIGIVLLGGNKIGNLARNKQQALDSLAKKNKSLNDTKDSLNAAIQVQKEIFKQDSIQKVTNQHYDGITTAVDSLLHADTTLRHKYDIRHMSYLEKFNLLQSRYIELNKQKTAWKETPKATREIRSE